MAEGSTEAIWVQFSPDGEIMRSERHPFEGGRRFVADVRPAVPVVKRAQLTEIRQDPKIRYALREIRQEFAKQARSITEELMQLYPEATGALGMASARLDELFGFTPTTRRGGSGRRRRLLCLLGFHRLVPMNWVTHDEADRGLVCNRCFKSFAEV